MSSQQIIRNPSVVREAVRNQRSREVATGFTESFRPRGSNEPQLEELAPEPQPESGKADRLDWELVALWFLFS